MKIVLFDYVFDPNQPGITGLSDLVWNWARHLAALGDEVHIVAPYPPHAQPPEGAIVHRFPLPPIGYRNILGHLLIALRGWQEIRRLEQVDVIHAPEYLSTSVFSTLSHHAPVILTVPGNIYERERHGNPFDWFTTQTLKVAARLSARNCARIVVTGQLMWEWWATTGTDPKRMTLLSHGVDVNHFRTIPEARAQLGLAANTPVVLYVGRLSPEKGIHLLVDAFRSLLEQFPGAQLHLVGNGPSADALQQQVQQKRLTESVVFHGWISPMDLPVYYSAASVTVLPSLSEGMPRTMLEALACGSPFVGTAITGIMDHVQDGETGLLVPPGDAPALRAALIEVLGHPDQAMHMARQGQRLVQQSLTWSHIVQAMRECVYEPVVQTWKEQRENCLR